MFYLADVAKILLVALVLIAASWWNANPRRTLLENTVLGAGVLLGTIGLCLALTGLSIGWKLPLWAIAAGVVLVFLLLPIGAPFNQKSHIFKSQARAAWRGVLRLRGWNLILSLYLIAVCLVTLVLCLTPPSGNDYDALVYHLAAPARYLMDGRIHELSYDHHSYFAFGTEMLFALGLQWSGPVLAKLFHWLMLPLCCGTLIAIGQRHFSLRTGLLMAVIFASLPVAASQATSAYIDLALTAWVLLATACFANWLCLKKEQTGQEQTGQEQTGQEQTGQEQTGQEQTGREARDESWLVWCGVMSGFGLSSKYLGALFVAGFGVWALAVMILEKSLRWKPLAGFALASVLAGGVWYARNWVWTGNPVFPFAFGIFGGKGWTAQMADEYTQSQLIYGFGRGLIDFLWLPWRISMAPLNGRQPFWPFSPEMMVPTANGANGLFEVNIFDMAISSFIGPVLLAFGLPLLFIRHKPKVIGLALWMVFCFVAFWFVSGQYLRYALPAFALLCIACGWGAQKYMQRSTPLRLCAALFLGLWCVFTPALIVKSSRFSWGVLSGAETPHTLLTRTVAAYPIFEWIEQNVASDAVIAVYGEPRCYYLQRKYFFADMMHNRLVDETKIHSAQDWIKALRANGATHVLWNSQPGPTGGVGGPPLQLEKAESENLLHLIYESRGYRVYQITISSGGNAP